MRLTVKSIVAQAAQKTGVKQEYIELMKASEGYFWCGKAGATFSESLAYNRLSDVSMERWIEDFEHRVNEVMSGLGMSEYAHFNDYIESIDWNVEFE
ncbi:hypothetical protein [Vibrio sonorensis]|uniref:hypothetical protein n=1 Tax=Vibrio sonorensis TaxID=1004316 RepID=UPI0008D91EB4|nr:hypothetical protein [Vibrio sonorensis]